MKRPCVIILNGTGSVGKSSVAKALQAIASEPFLHVSGDAFLEMLPGTMIDHPDGIMVERIAAGQGEPTLVIKLGAVVHRTLRGMRAAVAAMAAEGSNLIVDGIMLNAADQQDYRDRLSGVELHFIGLYAPLADLEQREKDRKDRLIGVARWQYHRVHEGMRYDLEIDTSVSSPSECASRIATATSIRCL
jgi:chloramphenicol 3-O phosphotransferase